MQLLKDERKWIFVLLFQKYKKSKIDISRYFYKRLCQIILLIEKLLFDMTPFGVIILMKPKGVIMFRR
jgi:hypothetical protein